jgi:uncharacterized sulfatase
MVELFDKQLTFLELLVEKGYVSFQSGKWWEGDPRDHGFSEAMTHGDVQHGGRHGDEGLTIGREGMGPIFDFITRAGDKPFFVWYAPFLPHTPHNPPEHLVARLTNQERNPERAKYLAMINWLDDTIGELLDFLEQTDKLDNTAVLYVVDNGWKQPTGSERMADSRAKMSPFDAGIRTPIILSWPGHIKQRRDEATLVSSLDLAPTILRLAGIEPPPNMSGVDLLSEINHSERQRLFGALFAHTAVDIHDPVANLKYRYVVRQDGWKLILPFLPNADVTLMIDGSEAEWMSPDTELYNVLEDPLEQNNLAQAHPELVDSLQSAIDGWWRP